MLDMQVVNDYSGSDKVLDTEPSSGQIPMLFVHIRDVRRATLPQRSGNEGWIGLSPVGDCYHVVVPVDVQIAKGVMACNWPTDGTPFGGYTGWLYFRCEPYDDETGDDKVNQEDGLRANCEGLLKFAASYGIKCELQAEGGVESPAVAHSSEHPQSMHPMQGTRTHDRDTEKLTASSDIARCLACGKRWRQLKDLLQEPTVRLVRYRVCPDDFRRGTYVFSHGCSGAIEVPVTRFARPLSTIKSLIGSQACPGLCHFETSLVACSAACEGACYRRIAAKLKSRSMG